MAAERANGRTAARRLPTLAVIALALGSLAFAGCFGGGDDDAAPAKGDPMRLDLLVYNIEYSGDASTDEVIRDQIQMTNASLRWTNRREHRARRTKST